MAQDVHDVVGHTLAVVAMQAGVAAHVIDRDPARAKELLGALAATSREALDGLRADLDRLRTPADAAARGPGKAATGRSSSSARREWHRRRPRPGLREAATRRRRHPCRQAPLAHHRRRRRPLRRRLRDAEGLRREAPHPGRRNPGGQVGAALGPSDEPRRHRRHRLGATNLWAEEADVVIGVLGPASRTSPPAPGRCSRARRMRVSINVTPFDTHRHNALPLVADATKLALEELSTLLGDYVATPAGPGAQGGLDRRARRASPRRRKGGSIRRQPTPR